MCTWELGEQRGLLGFGGQEMVDGLMVSMHVCVWGTSRVADRQVRKDVDSASTSSV